MEFRGASFQSNLVGSTVLKKLNQVSIDVLNRAKHLSSKLSEKLTYDNGRKMGALGIGIGIASALSFTTAGLWCIPIGVVAAGVSFIGNKSVDRTIVGPAVTRHRTFSEGLVDSCIVFKQNSLWLTKKICQGAMWLMLKHQELSST